MMILGRDREELPAMPTELQLGGANAEVHVILHPLPEPVLMGCVNAGLHLILPALHYLCVHSPQPDPLPGNILSPLLTDLRAHIGQSKSDVSGEILQRVQIDLLIDSPRPSLDAGHIGDAVRHHHQCDGSEDQVPFLRDSCDFLEERVEIRQGVGGREPGPQLRRDLLDVLSLEVVDRMEALGIAGLLAADAGDEQGLRFGQPAQLMEVAVNVMGQKGHGIVIIVLKGTAHIHPNEQGHGGFTLRARLLARLKVASHYCDQQDRGTDQRSGESGTEAVHGAAFFGCKCIAARVSLVSRTSFRFLNGILKNGREVTRIMAKFKAAAITWRNGSVRCPMSSLLFSCSHSISRLKSSSGARHQRSISGRACVTPLPSASGWTSGRRDIKASRGGVPNCPNKNQVMPRTPNQPKTAKDSVEMIPIRNCPLVCCAIHGERASTSARYRNMTSKNITNNSTRSI